MFTDFLRQRFQESADRPAIVWRDRAFEYGWLLDRIRFWDRTLEEERIPNGSTVAIEADFSPSSVALMLSLIDRACIVIPLTDSVAAKKAEFMEIAECETSVRIDQDDSYRVVRYARKADHELYRSLRSQGHPGLVLFSSGSTGKSKAALHDFCGLLEKFKVQRHSMRAVTFLLFDHIGGINTLFYQLSNTGQTITVQERAPDAVLAAVEKYKVELLPASPTFFNLILLSEAYKRHDLSSLKVMTYGTEPMQESTLKRFHSLFPNIRLQQTYGLSEVGILRSKSASSDSLWVKIGGEGFETRVVDGVLQIKAQSAMLGYLNHPSPFTADGWFDTGDLVAVEGENVRFLGRRSEVINVGGEKVHPSEVESVIQEIGEVGQVAVYGEKNLIMGNIVCADVKLRDGVSDPKEIARKIKIHCASRLQPFKVPVKVQIIGDDLHGARFKIMRRRDS